MGSKNRPVVGVSPLWDGAQNSVWMLPGYLEGLIRAGALPVILPLTADESLIAEIADRFDGFLLSGGPDIDPEIYGEKLLPTCGEIVAARDTLELNLAKLALAAHKPIFGICRGLQVLNVAMGGTLYQDIPTDTDSTVSHRMAEPYDRAAHDVELFGYFAELLGVNTLGVNSLHHQGIKDLAPGLAVGAKAPDGIVEGVYLPGDQFAVAVEWHPELALNWPSSQTLFKTFVNACTPING